MTTTLELTEVEIDEESQCSVRVDGPEDGPCGKEITRVVHEPWTPGNFEIECCADCARDFIYNGYHPDAEADRELAAKKMIARLQPVAEAIKLELEAQS